MSVIKASGRYNWAYLRKGGSLVVIGFNYLDDISMAMAREEVNVFFLGSWHLAIGEEMDRVIPINKFIYYLL